MSIRPLALASILSLTSGVFGACNSDAPAKTVNNNGPSNRTPTYVFDIVREYPHDPLAYTQGLQWFQNRLFEGTGQIGKSSIREVELLTGKVLRKRDLPPPHFGEGIVILGDNLYQLTWQTQKAFVYDWRTFAPKKEFTYEGEGWGLTTDGTSLIMSDGKSVIRFRDPATFAEQRAISVTDNGTPVNNLNELEWVKGEIWANIWQSDQIARINPSNGHVVGWIDLAGILPPMERTGDEEVLNGIAYDAVEDRIFVTGKNWPKLFEIKLKQRS
jgi:glutaminyl-peptide cyclotransferase